MILTAKTDAAIYSDSDVVYIKPIDQLWGHLQQMTDRQVAAISPTTGHPIDVRGENVNFIPSSSGNFQINSGVRYQTTLIKEMITSRPTLRGFVSTF